MLITFNSPAAGDLIMFRSDAERILTLLGKDISESKGVLTVEQMPAAIEKLQEAINLAKHSSNTEPPKEDAEHEADGEEPPEAPPVSFNLRAQPFLEFLQTSLAGNKAITWGV